MIPGRKPASKAIPILAIGSLLLLGSCCAGLAIFGSTLKPDESGTESFKGGPESRKLAAMIAPGMTAAQVESTLGRHVSEIPGNGAYQGIVYVVRYYPAKDGEVSVTFRSDDWTVAESANTISPSP